MFNFVQGQASGPEGKAKILATGIHDKYFEDLSAGGGLKSESEAGGSRAPPGIARLQPRRTDAQARWAGDWAKGGVFQRSQLPDQ